MSILRAIAFAALMPGMAFGEMRLMMVEQSGCSYCAAWHAEIGPEYPKTAEGIAAPLMRQDLRADLPEGVSLISRPVFTPTFILLVDGQEQSRIEGYPSEDFFWPMLADMIAKATKS